jgi:hypothetical protein
LRVFCKREPCGEFSSIWRSRFHAGCSKGHDFSAGGKIWIWLLWINLAVVMVWSFKTATPGSIILGLASFKLARDLVTLPGVFRLARAVPAQIS